MTALSVSFTVTVNATGDYYFDARDLTRHVQGWLSDALEDRDDLTTTEVRALSPAEAQMLGYALDLAHDEMSARPDEFSDDDREAVDALRRIAAQPTQEQP